MFGFLAVAVSVMAFFPYIRDILCGKTKPQRATWTVWAVLATLSALANFSSGDSQALGFVSIQAGATVLVAALALIYGARDRFSRLDLVTMAGATVGLLVWYVLDLPAYALAISISLSALGAIPTLIKTFTTPENECLSAWALLLASSVLAVLAVGWAAPVMLAYPLYLVVLYTSILAAFWAGQLWRSIGRIGALPQSAAPVVA